MIVKSRSRIGAVESTTGIETEHRRSLRNCSLYRAISGLVVPTPQKWSVTPDTLVDVNNIEMRANSLVYLRKITL